MEGHYLLRPLSALAAVSAVDGASAANPRFDGGVIFFPGGGFLW
jgi:hypothetical protein